MASEKVAVVTGANKGIGLAVVEGLCKKYDGVVYLTARDVSRGEAAVASLKEKGLNPKFYQLDVSDQSSVGRFRDYLMKTHGGLDVLINNAAVLYWTHGPGGTQAEETMEINYFSQLRVCDALFPILRENGRVINVSSELGHLSVIGSLDLKAKLNDPKLTMVELNKLAQKFVEDAKANRDQAEGWGGSFAIAYSITKVLLSAATKIQQRAFDGESPNRNISVNSVHPGWVDTHLSKHTGFWNTEQGSRAPLWLALEAPQSVKGQYVWKNATVLPWDLETLELETSSYDHSTRIGD